MKQLNWTYETPEDMDKFFNSKLNDINPFLVKLMRCHYYPEYETDFLAAIYPVEIKELKHLPPIASPNRWLHKRETITRKGSTWIETRGEWEGAYHKALDQAVSFLNKLDPNEAIYAKVLITPIQGGRVVFYITWPEAAK